MAKRKISIQKQNCIGFFEPMVFISLTELLYHHHYHHLRRRHHHNHHHHHRRRRRHNHHHHHHHHHHLGIAESTLYSTAAPRQTSGRVRKLCKCGL
jgi:hypothetical protein